VKIGVLASGSGTILAALAEAQLPIVVVLVDRPCAAEDVAAGAGLKLERVERKSYGAAFDRDAYTREVVGTLRSHGVELVAMAGFATVLGPAAPEALPGRILNTHPSLLPSFKGWHAVSEALEAGVTVTGCTIHVATAEVDDGPILAQEAVPVLAGDTVETLHERIKRVERRLYPETVRRFVEERETFERGSGCER
jgi:phosphoribosylglycinamide formyltransferase-1